VSLFRRVATLVLVPLSIGLQAANAFVNEVLWSWTRK
jgi:hypothetical protein